MSGLQASLSPASHECETVPQFARLRAWLSEPSYVVGAAVAVTLAIPTWIDLHIFGLSIDFRIWVAAVVMIGYCVHPHARIRSRINAIDIAVCGLIVTHVASDWSHGGWNASVPLLSYGEWWLPFAAGRFAMIAHRSIAVHSPVFLVIAVTLSAGAVFESLTAINVWEFVFGQVDDLVTRIYGKRYDLLYRAIGPTRQPIFLGIVLLLLVPWAVGLAFGQGKLRWFGIIGVGCLLAGIFATVSRGPLIALFVALLAMGSFYSVWIRRGTVAFGIIGALICITFWPQLVGVLERSEELEQHVSIIEVDGEFYQYTGTRNRLYVMQIYAPLVVQGGPLGYGTEAVSSFPPNIAGVPTEPRARRALGIVDNSYVLLGLRFGLLGLFFLVMMLAAAVCTAFSLARRQSLVTYPSGPVFLVAMASILTGICVEILTVFSSYDFFFWILFSCGIVSGLAALDARLLWAEEEPA